MRLDILSCCRRRRGAAWFTDVLALTVTRASNILRLLAGFFAAAILGACDDRSPFAISRERHPEYYEALANVNDPSTRRPPRAEPSSPPVPPDLSELPGETLEVAPGDLEGPGTPFDIRAVRVAGGLRIDVNDPVFTDRLDSLFDGDTTTLSRTEDVNPLILVFRLEAPIRIAAVRIFPSYSTYDWAVLADPQGPRFVIREAAADQWSRIDLPGEIETREIRVELRRLVRDDYVHINELELLVND